MPFDLCDHPPGLVPAFRLILQVHVLDLHPVLRRAAHRSFEVGFDQPREHRIVPQPDEIGDPVSFTIFVNVRVRESRITSEPEQLELLPVPNDDGLDEIESAVCGIE